MKTKQAHKAVLKRLAIGPRAEKDLTHGGDLDLGNAALHIVRNLCEAQALGLCVKIGEDWHLTGSGREALDVAPVQSVKRICAMSMTAPYDGKELRQLGNRVNAYDFLDIPSRFFDQRVYRKDAKTNQNGL